MSAYTHLIWDFNGTILDDVDVCIRTANRLLSAHGLPVLRSAEQYRGVFGFPIVEYYQRMGFDFERTPYSELAIEWTEYYGAISNEAGLYPDVMKTLEWAKRRGLEQIILSASEKGMLARQTEALGIRPYFAELLALDNIHAHSKEELGVAWRARNPDARPLMLGDTEHDAGVAAAMGADCILLASGHRPKEALERTGCLFVANSLCEAVDRLQAMKRI